MDINQCVIRSFYPNEEYTKEGLEEKFKGMKKDLIEFVQENMMLKNVVELQKLDKLFLLFSIIEGLRIMHIHIRRTYMNTL